MIPPTMEELILSGAVEVAGLDSDSGEFLYSFTPKLREIMPALWNDRLQFIYEEIVDLEGLGFLYVEEVENKSPNVSLTDKAFDENEISQLPKNKQETIRELRRLFES
jgi:hypothetical protein